MGKSAFVAVVGRPSAGKSTLLNTLCGWKVAIVSPVPQTTQNTIRGILTRPEGQLVFLDTPGYHDSDKKLNRRLADLARGALADADLVLYVIDAARAPGEEEELIAALVRGAAGRLVVAVNKIDESGADPARARSFVREHLAPAEEPEGGPRKSGARPVAGEDRPASGPVATGASLAEADIFDISALKGIGIEPLVARLLERAPEGQPYYPEEYVTDQEPAFRIAEIIREKAMNATRDEVPHALYVDIEDADFNEQKTILRVTAAICVERETQKGIVIGKGAAVIKKIRTEAEKDLDDVFPYRVRLELSVKVRPGWRSDDSILKKLVF